MKIVFFGTSKFSIPILEKLIEFKMKPYLVVATPDIPAKRNLKVSASPIKKVAEKNNIKIIQPEKLDTKAIKEIGKADLFIVASYGKILPKALLKIPTKGTINVHPSLLPKYRGPSPIQSFLMNNENETGVSIMLVDEKIDHGPILAQIPYPVIGYPTKEDLEKELAVIGANLLLSTVQKWLNDEIQPIVQDDAEATLTKTLTKEDGRISWDNSAEEIERQVRALFPWPGAFTTNSKRIKILKARVVKEQGNKGWTFKTKDGYLGVYAEKNAILIEELQLEGGKPMSSKEFLLGNKEIINTMLY